MTTPNPLKLSLSSMSSVTTDKVLSLCGTRGRLINLLQNESSKAANNSVTQFYGVIHQENLCAKSFKMDNVMFVVTKTVNFFHCTILRH